MWRRWVLLFFVFIIFFFTLFLFLPLPLDDLYTSCIIVHGLPPQVRLIRLIRAQAQAVVKELRKEEDKST